MCTPFHAVQGTDPRMSFAGEPTKDRDQQQVSADEVQATMHQIHEHLRVVMRQSQAVQGKGANRRRIPAPNMQQGSHVWLDAWHIQTTSPTRTPDWKCLGPSTVVHRISPYASGLELPASLWIHRAQPVCLVNPVLNDPLEGHRVNPRPPGEVDGEEEYQISSVDNTRMYRNQCQCLIRSTGYDSLTWESAKFVDSLQAVGEFQHRYPQKPGPLEGVLGERRTYTRDTINTQVVSDGYGWFFWNSIGCVESISVMDRRRRW